jgi:hypothetical protein
MSVRECNWSSLNNNTGKSGDLSVLTLTGVDTNQNTVTVMINKLGTYAIMGVSSDPTIDKLIVYPTPFCNITRFAFNMGSEGDIRIEIYTLTGRLLKVLTKQVVSSQEGFIELEYDGTDNKGDQVANGTYIYKLKTKNSNKHYEKTGKLVRIK